MKINIHNMFLKFSFVIFLHFTLNVTAFAGPSPPVLEHSVFSDHKNFLFSLVVIIIFLFVFVWVYFSTKKNNKLVINNERHFRTLLESTSAVPWELDLSTWLFTYIGPQIEGLTGFKPEEWYVENFWADHLHPADKEPSLLFCSESTARHEDHEFEYRFIKKDGTTMWIRDAVKVIVENKKPAKLIGFMFDITKNKEEKEKQNKTEQNLAEAQNVAHIGSWDFDLIKNNLEWSEEAYRIFEIDPNDNKISYDKFINYVHPDDRERLEICYRESLENKTPYEIEHRLLLPDGRIKYLNGKGKHLYNDEGIPYRSLGSVQDITERKRTDDAIKRIASAVYSGLGDRFYENLITNMAEMFDADYAFIGLLDKNDPMLVNTYVAYGKGHIIPNISYSLSGTPCMNVVGKSACSYAENVQHLFPNDQLLTDMDVDSYIGLPIYSSDSQAIGLVVVLDSKPMKNAAQMEEVLKIFVERIEAELDRKKSYQIIQQLSLAVEQSPNIIIITNANGKIEYVNPVFTEITGYSKEEVLNKSTSILNSGLMSKEFYENLWGTIKAGKTWTGEFQNKRSNGELYWDDAKISPIKNRHGEITHYLSTQSDVTEQREVEQQLRRSQKMDALGKLTGGIAHDYNNMLNVILGYTELLEIVIDNDAGGKASDFIKEIKVATDRGSNLTKKLLAFSRQESAEPENVDINQMLLDTKNMLEKTLTARIKLEYQLTDFIWSVFLDKNDLEDAVLNMCINAMHAMPDGGDLILSTFNRTLIDEEAKVLGLSGGEYVLLSLSDTGCGIDADALNQIFDPFFTTKGNLGTGLGLTQVYGFVKRAKGAITVDSNLNDGTYILIYFPRNYFANETNTVVSDEIENLTGTETILVVDDEVAICNLSKNLLKTKGYNVIIANSGDEALEKLCDNDVDLMLSDVIMPNMDGYKLSSKVRKKFPHIKIQLVSGFDDDRKRTEEDEILAQRLLHKPYKAYDLLSVIRKRLDE